MSREFKKYLLSLALFGSNGIVASAISLPAEQIVLLRTLLGAILLTLALALASRRDGEGARLAFLEHPRQALALACSGAALGMGWIFLFEAYQLVGVGAASLAYYCGPVIVMALSPLLFKESLTPGKLAGFAAVAAGAFLVAFQPGGAALDARGLMLGGLSAVMYAVMVVFSKRAPEVRGLEAASIQIVASFAAVALHTALGAGLPTPAAVASAGLPAIVMLGVVNTGIGCYLYFSSIGRLPVQRVAVCGYLEPLSAVALSVLLLGEPLTPCRALGAALIVGGAAACELWGRRPLVPSGSVASSDGA
ncbi:DMT family transporter [Olsenella urininfantis]|uniref:DMT family transporter n=1 Tax=Olsenella urininfantis TaxID=1871033 RepID=UPI000984F9FB|nr:DMT family transporter [Olsenella urininfantis]